MEWAFVTGGMGTIGVVAGVVGGATPGIGGATVVAGYRSSGSGATVVGMTKDTTKVRQRNPGAAQ